MCDRCESTCFPCLGVELVACQPVGHSRGESPRSAMLPTSCPHLTPSLVPPWPDVPLPTTAPWQPASATEPPRENSSHFYMYVPPLRNEAGAAAAQPHRRADRRHNAHACPRRHPRRADPHRSRAARCAERQARQADQPHRRVHACAYGALCGAHGLSLPDLATLGGAVTRCNGVTRDDVNQ